MIERKNSGKRFTGLEQWKSEFFQKNYVKVIDIQSIDCNTKTKLYRFYILVNYTKRTSEEKKSSLTLLEQVIEIRDIEDSRDIRRARRAFEYRANAAINKTKAKNPNFQKMFAEIPLTKLDWGHFYPDGFN